MSHTISEITEWQIYNEDARRENRIIILEVIEEFKKARSKRLRNDLHNTIIKYLISHHDHTGGYLTPIFKTAGETAVYFGLTRKTIERWKKKPDFPFDGQIYDTWAICCWLNENEKLDENWEIIKSKKFQKGK